MCLKCKEPVSVFEVQNPSNPSQSFTARGDCSCVTAALKREEALRSEQERMRRREEIARQFEGLELPTGYAGKSVENFEITPGTQKAHRAAVRFIETAPERLSKGQGLILSGPCGVGKSHLAAAIANALNQGERYSAVYASAGSLLERIKSLWGNGERLQALQRAIIAADCLMLEDLGQEVADRRELAYLFTWLDGRYQSGRSIVITTNLDPEALKARYGEAIIDRLRERCFPIAVTGESYRARLRENWIGEED